MINLAYYLSLLFKAIPASKTTIIVEIGYLIGNLAIDSF
jgi:hypothetical protein